jgi:hypothetical protein
MSIFSRIKEAIWERDIFGRDPKPSARPTQPTAAPKPAPAPTPASAPAPQVDVEAVLTNLAQKSSQKLNWQSSIVDLMKLIGIDSSLENRKELARELGYTADTSDSAAMNIWLHKRVMQELQKNGGKVPASLVA